MVSLISFVSVILNIVLNFTLKPYMGISGLALATSISSIICFLLYLFFMKKYIGFNILDIIKKICIIIVVNVIRLLLFNFIFIKLEINIYMNMFATLVFSLITIFALYYILKFEELFEIIELINKKIKFRHKNGE